MRGAAAFRVAALAGAVTAACDGRPSASEWDGAVVRAVARRVDDAGSGRRLLILDREGGSGAELPWSVRQALVTSGYEVGDGDGAGPRAAGIRVLTFDAAVRNGPDWLVDVRIRNVGEDDASAAGVRWRVRCIDSPCEVVDSLAIPGRGGGAE